MKEKKMWKIKDMKSGGRSALRKNYWRIVGISILMTFLVGGVELGLYFDQPSGSLENGKLYVNTNADILRDWQISMGDITEGDGEERALAFLESIIIPQRACWQRFTIRLRLKDQCCTAYWTLSTTWSSRTDWEKVL